MPIRLTVVIAQASARDQVASQLEESLAAELMMARGLDPVMVAALERIEPGSTDHLCLTGLGGPAVVLGWCDAAQAARHWQRLGLSGHLVERDGTARSGQRRVHYMEMRPGMQVTEVLRYVQDLLESYRTPVVPLQLNTGRAAEGNAAGWGPEPISGSPISRDAGGGRRDAIERHPGGTSGTPAGSQPAAPSQRASEPAGIEPQGRPAPADAVEEQGGSDEEPEWEHLDRLVDDLDASGI
ncbi:MAG: hypothetical protein D6753_09625 [Planctomycetota bacterium]|nr:MAG: hypothetical protein D6753_09625 [Planctomycetota bacterium]